MRVTYLDLVDYLAIAAEVAGLDGATLSRVTQLNLADSLSTHPRRGGAGMHRRALPESRRGSATTSKAHRVPCRNRNVMPPSLSARPEAALSMGRAAELWRVKS